MSSFFNLSWLYVPSVHTSERGERQAAYHVGTPPSFFAPPKSVADRAIHALAI